MSELKGLVVFVKTSDFMQEKMEKSEVQLILAFAPIQCFVRTLRLSVPGWILKKTAQERLEQ